MFQGWNGRVCDAWSLQRRFAARLRLPPGLPSGLLVAVECAEISGGGGLDDLRETRLQDLLSEKARPNCVSDHTLDAWFGCDESSQVCRSSDVPCSFEPNSGLAGAEGCSCCLR